MFSFQCYKKTNLILKSKNRQKFKWVVNLAKTCSAKKKKKRIQSQNLLQCFFFFQFSLCKCKVQKKSLRASSRKYSIFCEAKDVYSAYLKFDHLHHWLPCASSSNPTVHCSSWAVHCSSWAAPTRYFSSTFCSGFACSRLMTVLPILCFC